MNEIARQNVETFHAPLDRMGRRNNSGSAHNSFKHGMVRTPEYRAWRNMIDRCTRPTTKNFKDYGGRGITVCEQWRASFQRFFSDMGPRTSPSHSLERRDTNGHYEPSNCCWATRVEQNANRRDGKRWIIDGREFATSAEAARALGVDQSTIVRRCNGYRRSSDGRPVQPVEDCAAQPKYGEPNG